MLTEDEIAGKMIFNKLLFVEDRRAAGMTNKDFYAFCRDRRKGESDAHKKAALSDVYGYMWECGVSGELIV